MSHQSCDDVPVFVKPNWLMGNQVKHTNGSKAQVILYWNETSLSKLLQYSTALYNNDIKGYHAYLCNKLHSIATAIY